MQSRFFKIVIGVLCIYFIISVIISCFTPNVMSQIGEWQAYGLNRVPEIDGYYPEWEWSNALDTFGAESLDYKGKYLREKRVDFFLNRHSPTDKMCNQYELE